MKFTASTSIERVLNTIKENRNSVNHAFDGKKSPKTLYKNKSMSSILEEHLKNNATMLLNNSKLGIRHSIR